jgi:hypothetical protein
VVEEPGEPDREAAGDADLADPPGICGAGRLQPIKDFVKFVETHWDGIVDWQDSRISNGLLEGTNSLIQAGQGPRARGYRSTTKMITIVYLIAGKLPNPSPYVAHPIQRIAQRSPDHDGRRCRAVAAR